MKIDKVTQWYYEIVYAERVEGIKFFLASSCLLIYINVVMYCKYGYNNLSNNIIGI